MTIYSCVRHEPNIAADTMCSYCHMWFPVPELVARGVIHQMFPLHEQRILNQLMTSWVQAVCERQPLGRKYHGFSFEKKLAGPLTSGLSNTVILINPKKYAMINK